MMREVGREGLEADVVPAGYKQTEVGVIPEDWNIVRLNDVVDFLDGRRKPVKESERATMSGNYPYYGASGVVDYVNDYLFDEELILLAEDGENILSRSTRLAFRVSGKIWVNNHAHVLRPKPDVSIDFLTEYLESLDYSKYNSGTAQPKLNKKTCERIEVVSPPLPEQRAIASALSDVDELLTALEQLIAKKRDLKQGAMQQLLTGKRRLPGFGEGKGYKKTEVGVIPEDWRLATLEEICMFENGDRGENYPSQKDFAFSGVPFINAGHIDKGQINLASMDHITFDSYNRLGGGKIKPNDILFCLRGSGQLQLI